MSSMQMKKLADNPSVRSTRYNPDVYEIKALGSGNWRAIHAHHGIVTPNHFKNSPCPKCGGENRFSNRKNYDEDGSWFCRGGGNPQSGDGIGLIMHASHISFPEVLNSIADYLGLNSSMSSEERQRIRKKAAEAKAKFAKEAIRRTELARQDSYMLDCAFALESEIKGRQGQRLSEHSSSELLIAARLYGALVQKYGGLRYER